MATGRRPKRPPSEGDSGQTAPDPRDLRQTGRIGGLTGWLNTDYLIDVHLARANGAPLVVANIQVELYLDDLQNKLIEAVAAKANPANDVLLISTGVVDNYGYVVPYDPVPGAYYIVRHIRTR
jgi:hypothetical protein